MVLTVLKRLTMKKGQNLLQNPSSKPNKYQSGLFVTKIVKNANEDNVIS